MIRVLFLIRDLGQGGAEKVLVNLVNNMNPEMFDISVITLFGGGVNEQFLKPHVHYQSVFQKNIRGSTRMMKLVSPEILHRFVIKEKYDIEVSYLEGPSARIISGCRDRGTTKLISWIHVEQQTEKKVAKAFRSFAEAKRCYGRFDRTVCVSEFVKRDFSALVPLERTPIVLHNTVESEQIRQRSLEGTNRMNSGNAIKLIAVGTLKESKGYLRLLRVFQRLLQEGFPAHLYILGIGPQESEIRAFIDECRIENAVTLLGYDTNPYKYVKNADIFVCASYAEGFSTAATESLIVGTPVCTVNVSGMTEMLGENNEFGIVTENTENALYAGLRQLIESRELREHYKLKALERSAVFATNATVGRVQELFLELVGQS